MAQSVKEFIRKSMRMISANGPSVPLRGEDYLTALEILNDLLSSYGITGQFNPISQEIVINAKANKGDYIFTDEITDPLADYTGGRLVDVLNAWILFEGVRYPLRSNTRNRFNNSALYNPQTGLPLEFIIFDQLDETILRLWPAPVQDYTLVIDGKIQPNYVNSCMELNIPSYMTLFLKYAHAKQCALGLNRESAWTQRLEDQFIELERQMINKSPRNLDLGTAQPGLNGATLVASGLFFYDDY